MMQCMQFTLRGVPEEIDDAIRRRARETGNSINQVLLELLGVATGVDQEGRHRRDLEALAGAWEEDSAIDDALMAFEAIDEEAWR